jgi:hypothetical protein
MLWHLKRMEGAGLFRPRAVLCGRLSQEKEVHFCRSLVPRRKHRCHRIRVDMTGAFLKNGGRACKPDSIMQKFGKFPKVSKLRITICHYMVYQIIC